MPDFLTYGKVELRPLEPDDIEVLYKWENDSSIWEVSNTKVPFSKYILAQYIKESYRDIYETRQLRLIVQTNAGHPVGAIDLFDFDPFHQRAGVGILIHKAEDRKRGYATDALSALENYALNVLGLHQLYANISSDNQVSIQLFQKLGFKISGTKKDWIKYRDGWKDEILLQKILV